MAEGDLGDNLNVRVLEARGLESSRSPYVTVVCGTESQNTKAVINSSDPDWSTTPTMIFTGVVNREQGGDLLIYVRHKGMNEDENEDLGMVTIPLDTAFAAPGMDFDEWRPLQKTRYMEGPPQGEIHISYTFNLDADLEQDEEEAEEDQDEALDKPPNVLIVEQMRASQLSTGATTSKGETILPRNPMLVLKCGQSEFKSHPQKDSANPTWDEEARLPVTEGTSLVEIVVQQTGLVARKFLGEGRVSLIEVANAGVEGRVIKVPLMDRDMSTESDFSRGEVTMHMRWVYDPQYDNQSRIFRLRFRRQKKKQDVPITDEIEEEEDQPHHQAFGKSPEELEQLEEEKELRRKEAERLLQLEEEEAASARVPGGDYVLQVHVIEARDLKGEDSGGTSDPFVVIECMGQKRVTRVIKEVVNCVFDELLFINLSDLTSEDIFEAKVKLSVYDWDRFTRNDLIGSHEFDFQAIYMKPDHEIYRQWCSLVDTEEEDDKGVQGYLKVSATILGPGDKQKVHDVEKEILEELVAEQQSGGDLGGMVLTGPDLKQELYYLVLTVYQAESFRPPLGSNSLRSFVQVDFAANPPCRTDSVGCSGEQFVSPEFKQDLWIPFLHPPMSTKIALSVLIRRYMRSSILMTTAYIDYADVKQVKMKDLEDERGFFDALSDREYKGPRPRWINMYSAPQVGKKGNSGIMNRSPNLASMYRGRLLVATKVITDADQDTPENIRAVDAEFPLTPSVLPKTVEYTLRAYVYQGSQLPKFIVSSMMKVEVHWGPHVLEYSFQEHDKGSVRWNEAKELTRIPFPEDMRQLPDVFVYLYRGPTVSPAVVSFARFKAVKLLEQPFDCSPAWYMLRRENSRGDGALGTIDDDDFPGALHLRLGLAHVDDVTSANWEEDQNVFQTEEPFALRAHIYQCRDLPATDQNALMDPYVKVRFAGTKRSTRPKYVTVNPLYFETLEFHDMLPRDPRYCPEIIVEVWDKKLTKSNFPVGMLRVPMEAAREGTVKDRHPGLPNWYPLLDVNGEGGQGDILCSFQRIRKRSPDQKLDRPPDLNPSRRTAWIEIYALGVRNLQPYNMHGINKAQARIDVASVKGNTQTFVTKSSNRPTARDANFLQRKVIEVELPDNPVYAPQLNIRVFNNRMLTSSIIGTASVNLDTKLPWSPNYAPPQQDLFDVIHSMKKKKKKKKGKGKKGKKRKKGKKGKKGDEDEDDDDDDDDAEDGGKKKKKKKGWMGRGKGGVGEEEEKKGLLDDEEEEKESLSSSDGEDEMFGGPVEEFEEGVGEEEKTYANANGVHFEGEEAGNDLLSNLASAVKGPHHGEEDQGAGALIHGEFELPEVVDREQQAEELAAERRKRIEAMPKEPEEDSWWSPPDIQGHMEQLGQDAEISMGDLDIEFPKSWHNAEYLAGREWFLNDGGEELEIDMRTMPFESYPLLRGASKVRPSWLGKPKTTLRTVGYFKGVIRVSMSDPRAESALSFKNLRQPAKYVVRLYVIKAANLQPKDRNGLADPYLRVRLGKQVVTDKEHAQEMTLEPGFYSFFEMPAEIPGASQLQVQVYDHDTFGVDEVIGETIIDLEDRWFHPKWQAYGEDDPRAGELGAIKPIEVRNLTIPNSLNAQGQIHLWLDVMTPAQANKFPPEELEPPPQLEYEVRVIVWKSEDIPAMDELEGMSDIFCRLWMQGQEKKRQETDTHWRCRNGAASWNWRLKFRVDLPLKPEMGRLNVQVWDADIITSNDVIGEASIDLYQWFMLAYHRKTSVKPFKELHDAAERKKRMGGNTEATDLEGGFGDEVEEEEDGGGGDGKEDGGDGEGDSERRDGAEDGGELDDMEAGNLGEDGAGGDGDGDDGEDDDEDTSAKKPLINKQEKSSGMSEEQKKKIREQKQEEANADDAKEAVRQLKNLVGMGDIPDDAQWLKLMYHDHENAVVEERGQVAISIEILPSDEAETKPAGKGRDDPNQNPFLPPPVGRMQLSMNPCVMLRELCGPALMFKVLCCCACVCCLVVMAFAGIYLQSFLIFIP